MKKMTKLMAALLATLLLATLAACGTKDQPSGDDQTGADGARVAPLASGFDAEAVTDGTLKAAFTNDDIELNDDGALVIHMTVCEYELFDAVDAHALKAGDTLVVRGQGIAVTSVEETDGVIHVNGGLENGGVTLAPSESGGTYYESNAEVTEFPYNYIDVGQLTLPVDADSFAYTDSSDLDAGEKTYLAGDLLTMKDSVDFSCSATNGTVEVSNGKITAITRVYMP